MKRIAIILLSLILASKTEAQQSKTFLAPDIWLRADKFNKGDKVWTDVSGNSHNAIPVSGFVPSADSLINYNKAVFFDGAISKFQIPFILTNPSQITVVSVYQSRGSLNEKGIWNVKISDDLDINLTDQRITGPQTIFRYADGSMNFPVVNTSVQFWGKSQATGSSPVITLGNASFQGSDVKPFAGTLGEYIIFNRLLSGLDLQMLQSYLSLKYGLTLQYTDYISSAGAVLWNYTAFREYSQTIAGIGRDDNFGLLQKQSAVSDGSDCLTVAAGKLSARNDANSYSIKNNDFLIWGSNGLSLQPERSSLENYPYKYPVLERKWIMSASGSTAWSIPTELKFKLPESVSECYLSIDRSGSGNFSSPAIEYLKADSISSSGEVFFKNVKWDTDKSGSDMFTLSFGMKNYVQVDNPSCFNQANGSMNVEVMGGNAPFQVRLVDSASNVVKQLNSSTRFISIDNLKAGNYQLTVVDAKSVSSLNKVSLTGPGQFTLPLKSTYTIPLGKSITISASETNNESAVYTWTSEDGLYSQNKDITISSPGVYNITVCDTSGCSVSKSITIEPEGGFKYKYNLFPNPSDGDYKLTVDLIDKSDVTIRIYNSHGSLVSENHGNGGSSYKFEGHLEIAGTYYVEIISVYGRESFKLIVSH